MVALAVSLLMTSPALVLATSVSDRSGEGVAGPPLPDYPKPPPSEKRLFYLQRSTNANTVVLRCQLFAIGPA